MSFLSNLSYNDNVQQEKDTLGGFSLLDGGIYTATIKYAYLSQSKSGAGAVNFEFDIDGKPYRETMYVTNKHGSNIWEKNGKSGYLPSFLTADAISLFATGEKSLFELKDTKKIINIYDKDAGKEIPTEVPMLTELLGKTIKLGIIKERVYKQEKSSTGGYLDTAETREQNTIDKVFSAKDNRTVPEVRAGKAEATFYQDWLTKYENQLIDKTSGKSNPPTQSANQPVKKSLFLA